MFLCVHAYKYIFVFVCAHLYVTEVNAQCLPQSFIHLYVYMLIF